MKKFLILLLLICLLQHSSAQPGEWTWIHGSATSGNPGSYGTQGIPSPTNEPPAAYEPMEWTDQNGNFWLYGGRSSAGDFFNALWKYDPVSNEWTWINGLSTK